MGRVAVCGTGTEVGKTYVSCSLLRQLADGVVGLKPVESGVAGRAADAEALAGAAGHPAVEPCYGLTDPVSPHLAARREGVRVDLERVVAWVATHGGDRCLVETAGGLLSPLNEGERNLDLVVRLEPRWVVLVTANRLGVLHDVECCLRLLALAGLGERVQVVLSGPLAEDASTGTNQSELQRLSPGLGVWACPWNGEVPEALVRCLR